MNRMQEYEQLLEEVTPPSSLDAVVSQALARARGRRVGRRATLCACAPVVVLIVFIALVNLLPGFAYACGRVPGFRDLAKAVAMSPSLRAAVDNDYVQTIGQQQASNGITMRVEYVIVDLKQLNIFYTLNSQKYQSLDVTPSIAAINGAPMHGYSITSGDSNEPNGTLLCSTVDFSEGDMPSALTLRADVRGQAMAGDEPVAAPLQANLADVTPPEPAPPVASFSFLLRFDPAFTQKGEIIALNQTFQLDGQTLTAESLEIYPTHIRFNLRDDPANSAWLKELRFYVQDDRGRRYEPPTNGILSTGIPDSPAMASFRLESPYFAKSNTLTLFITGATWLDKTHQRTRLDLAKGSADWLPQGVKLEQVQHTGNSWLLIFTGELRNGKTMAQLFDQDYYDEKGNRYEFHTWSSTGVEKDETRFRLQFALNDYNGDVVYLSPSFSNVITEQSPIEIPLK